MRRIGAHVSSAGSPVNALKNIQKIGGNCLQIFAGSPRTWARSLYPPSTVDLFHQQADELDLHPLFIHALYLINLGSENEELRHSSLNSLLIDMQNADALGALGVIVHLGSHQGRGYPACESSLLDAINSLLNQTSKTAFIIENAAGQAGKIGTLEEIESLLKCLPSPRLKVCLDTAHLFESGWDLRLPEEIDRLVKELEDRQILPHLVCLHLNDSKTAFNSKHDQHANLGDGQIGLDGMRYLVNHRKLSHLPLILEVPGENKAGPDERNLKLAQGLIA